MLRNESFYKKTFGAINLEILKQIEDIKANKGNKTAEFWEEKQRFCNNNATAFDIKILKQAMVRNTDCPRYIVDNILMDGDKDLCLDSLNRSDISAPSIKNFIIANISDARIKKEFKTALSNNREPKISTMFCNFMVEAFDSEKFDGYPYRYATNEEIIVEKIKKNELCENALTEVINNENLSDNTRKMAFEHGFNYTRLTSVPVGMVDEIIESAMSTIYDFDSSDKELSKARTYAASVINYCIEHDLLKPEHELQLHEKCMKDADKGNSRTNDAFMRRLLTKTQVPDLLKKAYDTHIYLNPMVDPDRVDFIISNTINRTLKYKKPGSTAFVSGMLSLQKYYENKRTFEKDEQVHIQFELMNFLNEHQKNKMDSTVWKMYSTMASSPYTSNSHLSTISNLHKTYAEAKYASFKAILMLKLNDIKINGKELSIQEKKDISNYMDKRDEKYPKIDINVNLELQKFLQDILDSKTFQPIRYQIKDFKKALQEMEEDHSLFGVRPDMFIPCQTYNSNTACELAFDANKFMKMSQEEKIKFYDDIGEKPLKRCRTILQDQMRNYIDRVDLYMQMSDLAETSAEMLDILKERHDYYKVKKSEPEIEEKETDFDELIDL